MAWKTVHPGISVNKMDCKIRLHVRRLLEARGYPAEGEQDPALVRAAVMEVLEALFKDDPGKARRIWKTMREALAKWLRDVEITIQSEMRLK